MRSSGDQHGHEGIVPGGRLALALEARLRGIGAGQVERTAARNLALLHKIALNLREERVQVKVRTAGMVPW